MAGCGSSTAGRPTASTATTSDPPVTTPRAHPQAVEPVAGQGAARTTAQVAQAASATAPGHDPVPTTAASDTSAVAKGAPSDAEVRAAIAKFQLAIATYHLDRLNLNYALLDPSQLPPGVWNVSIASVFTDYNLPIACGGVLHVPQLGVANKTLPCGTQILFLYNGRAIKVPVIDRGPYIAGREWDLTGATAEALKFPGLGPIQWRIVSTP
ncbi:MAG TPA: RlpA-like double-psi beta-barrel domain-containing protein [Solirubrobacteraceae bacterium]